jgi:tRNA 2-thiocytidine biosynthesis protein TtcA
MGFRTFDPTALAEYCRQQGWAWELVRLPGRQLLQEKQAEANPCSLCSRLRRGQLHAAADRWRATRIALGQHLDDLCVTLLMSLFRGGGLKTMGPNVPADHGRKRLIRPLCWVPESLIRDAAVRFRFPRIESCDYHSQLEAGDRAFLREELNRLDARFPGVRHAMLHGLRDVRVAHLLDRRYLGFGPEPQASTAPAPAATRTSRSGP